MIKAVFFDIDGTLLSHNSKKISLRVQQALKKLQQKGIKIFAATGRHKIELEELPLKEIFFDGYITLNGQFCYDNNGMIYDLPIHEKDVHYMYEQFKQKNLPVMFIEKEQMYINFIDDNVRLAQAAISTAVPKIAGYGDKNPIYQIIVYGSRQQTAELAKHLRYSKFTSWHDLAIDIIPKTGGKQNGIKALLEKFNIQKENTMAFGDGKNDIDMLQMVNIGIAMGNAVEDLKQIADYVTDTVDNDGIVQALRHYDLI